ncbi:hypothetical protein Moror_112 [Moniliophthora roreri MCA 2997]|uniref:RNA-dependent RNA polymerase n=2 Tax=Moniliophthora roreri TaxID=221103 RepID=V2XX70_MONRO|nr:hypothetical protein Moror_112 [Moniliophthora roreri MCA 2997]KAI3622672.1 hypothetical protein WG66_015474 [Moniliophthora roreri]
MEVFMSDITYSTNTNDVIRRLASIFHGPGYAGLFSNLPLNFNVRLFPDTNPRRGRRNHSGKGLLTLHSVELGQKFLLEYGELDGRPSPTQTVLFGSRRVKFFPSKNRARTDIVQKISKEPYVDPAAIEERERLEQFTASTTVEITSLSFGWECRDYVYSSEWELQCAPTGKLSLNLDRRELRIRFEHPSYPSGRLAIAVRLSDILQAHTYLYHTKDPVIFLSLDHAPSFETEPATPGSLRQRLPFLPVPGHERVAPFTSESLRLTCRSERDLRIFKDLGRTAQMHSIRDYEHPLERRDLFSREIMEILNLNFRRASWPVAFQLEKLMRELSLDPQEMVGIMHHILRMTRDRGTRHTSKFLKHFGHSLDEMWREGLDGTVEECFLLAEKSFADQVKAPSLIPSEGRLFDSLHVTITPTTMYLDGPFLDRSNRVIRSYDQKYHECFLRVSFLDEGSMQYRFDRDMDGPGFIRHRVGELLLEGLTIAGRKFTFLAYSQSALKEHAVWFVKPFQDPRLGRVDAAAIINGIGDFAKDPDLIRCPARYAARISQAFTATDATEVEVEEILLSNDITTVNGEYTFTDGVGTMSRELAREIWKELKATKRRSRRNRTKVAAYQIRLMGSKGMLSIDYKLKGRVLTLRPSMIKFQAPESNNVEIARAFDRPMNYYLNRPLIMLLEGLGVPYETFEKYQDKAVHEVQQATKNLVDAARMLETFGLGTSFRLTSVMLNLSRLGINNMDWDPFYHQMLQFAVHHVLRMLKNRARIPVPGCWTLVGVADVHGHLEEDEIFACVKPIDKPAIYLEGPVLISRSPTIHPGDVQVVHAIGKPPEGSCFAHEHLPNTVVFSIKGARPLPSFLGGGDLDGDDYNLIPLSKLPEFTPANNYQPAEYKTAEKKMLDRPSTIADVAEFVMEYINSNLLGIIATNWLIIADQSQQGILDPDCLKLAELHSLAVDYPKTGMPVPHKSIPKLKFKAKPDYQAPETANVSSNTNYYPSQRAIGRLFRRIDLPPLQTNVPLGRDQRRRIRDGRDGSGGSVNNLARSLAHIRIPDNPLVEVLEEHVGQYIRIPEEPDQEMREHVAQIFKRFCAEVTQIMNSNTLSHSRMSLLSEEEAIIGTIAQKTSQPRRRKDLMAKLREQTDILVRGVREELEGDDSLTAEKSLEYAWVAWELAITRPKSTIGAQSFGWIALGSIFEAIKEIDDSRRSRTGSHWSRY